MSAAEINDEAARVAVRTDDMNVTAAVVRLRPEAGLSPRGQAALEYVQRAMAVFQCHTIESDRECSCGRVRCPSAGKHPRNKGWQAEATADEVTIRQLWAENDANIGVPCGERNNLLVLDVDGEVGMDTLRELELEHGELPETPIVHTPNGLHYYFQHENGLNNAVRFTPGLDIRTTGGFVVGAGSRNRAGEYVWDVAYTLSDAIKPAKAPGWLLDLIRSKAGAAKGGEAFKLNDGPIPNGQRNNTLYRLGRSLKAKGVSGSAIRAALESENRARCQPPLDARELEQVLHQVLTQPDQGDWKSAQAGLALSPGTKEPPRPLRRDIPRSEPFPVDAMGELMGNAARGIHDRVRAPIAICAQSVLAAANLAVQGHADIELPTGAIRPISIFLTTIAETGERKTTADDLALSGVKQREEELAREYDQEYPAYKNDLGAWEKQRSQILGDKKKYTTRQDKKRALGEMGDAPNAPAPPLLTCPEPTFEGLTRLLREGALSVGVFSGEGGQFIGGHAMSEENRLKTASALSDLWDGHPVKRVRQGDGYFVLRGRRVGLHLLVQPGVAVRLFGDEVLRDQGVLSRVLAVMPDTAAGTRFQREPNPENFSHLSSFSRGCLEFLKKPLPLAGTKTPELNPRILTMSEGARGLWGEFADAIEGQIGPGGALEPVRGLANKAPEHAARLAGTIELVADLHVAALSPDAMAKGIVLVQHYLGEALRIRAISIVQPDLELAARLLRWLQKDWPEPNRLVSLPDIYQLGLHAIRDQQTAARIVAILEQHGWLERVEGGAKVNGTPRRQVWEIITTEAET